MENLQKIKKVYFKEEIPKHLSSGAIIHHDIGMVGGVHWSIDMVLNEREGHSRLPFCLTDTLQNITARVKLHSFSQKGKVFAVGTIQFAINVFPSIEWSLCKKQFHFLFEEGHNTEMTDEYPAKKLNPQMHQYLKNSKYYFFIGGDITFYSATETDPDDENAVKTVKEYTTKAASMNELSYDLKNILVEPVFPDLHLLCGSEDLPAHRAILSGRSPVFAAMFQSPMKENMENEIVIEDMDSTVLKSMLEYIYSGHIYELSNSSACELMSAAEKYHLPGLKKLCVEHLESEVNVNNVLRVLEFADLHDENLKAHAMEIASKHYDYLKTMPEWNIFKSERGSLAMEIMDCKIQSLKSNY